MGSSLIRLNLYHDSTTNGIGFRSVTGQLLPTRGPLRALRGGLLALTSSALAVAAHAVAGGMLPDTGLTLLLTLAVGAAGTALADRRAGGLAILGALGLSHLGIHLILSIVALDEAGGPVNGWLMSGGHLVAVLLAAAVLTRAEAAFFALAAVCALLLPSRLPGPLTPGTGPARVLLRAFPPADRALAVLLRRARPRRGPPLAWR